jgi:single-stranded DNA-binding protein
MSKAYAVIEGFVTTGIEFKYIKEKDIDLLKFTVMVPGYHDDEEPTFINVRAWGKKARMFRALISEKAYVHVEGFMKQRRFEVVAADGSAQKISTIGVVAGYVDLPREK